MPHLRLEYSANIKEKVDLEKVFSLCHEALVATVNADLFRCQSQAFCCDHFCVGSGVSNEAFIYLQLMLFEGRSLPQLQEAGKQLLQILEECFAQSIMGLNVQIAVHVVEFASDHYFKVE